MKQSDWIEELVAQVESKPEFPVVVFVDVDTKLVYEIDDIQMGVVNGEDQITVKIARV